MNREEAKTGLVAFLTARLGEIEQEAKHRTIHHVGCALFRRPAVGETHRCDCKVPEWAQADVEAKRRLTEEYQKVDELLVEHRDAPVNFERGLWAGLDVAVRLAAQPFDWHADYREEWRGAVAVDEDEER